ncbi:MAG: hypothetical protein MR716_00855 [Tenericutes bacterium]|nr:hypothetical protein [Mycoplasmatota bacterium]
MTNKKKLELVSNNIQLTLNTNNFTTSIKYSKNKIKGFCRQYRLYDIPKAK